MACQAASQHGINVAVCPSDEQAYTGLRMLPRLQVFRPYVCEMRPWDAVDFLQCTARRRIIMVGDMSMHQLFNSLACLLSKGIQEGSQMPWEVHL